LKYDQYALTKSFFEYHVKKNGVGGACSTYGVEERYIHDFGGEFERIKPVGRPRRKWEDNVKMDLYEG
jgi:hypothetical protein